MTTKETNMINTRLKAVIADTNNYKFICQKNPKPFYTKFFVSSEERVDLIKDCTAAGLVLYEYYLRLASVGDVEITDEAAAIFFGWTERTTRRNRMNLINANWLYVQKLSNRSGAKSDIYYLGKEVVELYKTSHNINQ
jgi:hypothetical protein